MNKKSFTGEIGLISTCAKLQTSVATQLQNEIILRTLPNWQIVIEQSLYHGVLPLVYYNLLKIKELRPPKNIQAILKNSYTITLDRNLALWKEFSFLQAALKQSEIEIIPLKGIILHKTLYPDAGLRPMIDIDILIREENLFQAEKYILQLGYQKQLKNLPENYWKMYQAHFSFYNSSKKIILELHWQLAPPRPNVLDLTNVWENSQIQIIDQVPVLSLSPEDTLLSLWLHIGKNITSLQHLKLKNLCDIHELITQHNNDLNWDYLAKKIGYWKIKRLFSYLHYLTKKYLDTPWPINIEKRPHYCAVSKRLLTSWIPSLKSLGRAQAALLMLLMLDGLKERLALLLIWLSMIYQKNKFLILHCKTR
ncbi:MAG: nucleotidyltransferase family protein [Candidatus Omnitrophota bacterium]